jgi:hypothetical protein
MLERNEQAAYMQMMFGIHARQVPAWMFVQRSGDGVSFVGASASSALTWESTQTHQLVLGDVVVRPHFAVASDVFRGRGLQGLATADHGEFLSAADMSVLCDPMGRILKYQQNVAEILARD